MPLTSAQLQTLKTSIDGNTNTIPAGRPFAGTAINALPATDDANIEIALWYNGLVNPIYLVWNQAAAIKSIRGAVDLSKYTPSDAPPAATGNAQGTNDALLYNNRALMCQLKQANAVFLIQGEGSVDCAPAQFRASFNDCMTAIPSGAGGNNQNAGWGTAAAPGAVRLAMQRSATNVEKLFSVQAAGSSSAGNDTGTARGSNTNPDALVVSGSISQGDVAAARALP